MLARLYVSRFSGMQNHDMITKPQRRSKTARRLQPYTCFTRPVAALPSALAPGRVELSTNLLLLSQPKNMAKKKGNNSKSNAASVEAIPRGSDDAASAGTQPAPAAQPQPVEQMDAAELRAELMAARAELAKLRSQAGTTAAGKLGKQPEEVQELHTKLQQLRKDQQEADAARDKAWMQLKVCSHTHVCTSNRQTPVCKCTSKHTCLDAAAALSVTVVLATAEP